MLLDSAPPQIRGSEDNVSFLSEERVGESEVMGARRIKSTSDLRDQKGSKTTPSFLRRIQLRRLPRPLSGASPYTTTAYSYSTTNLLTESPPASLLPYDSPTFSESSTSIDLPTASTSSTRSGATTPSKQHHRKPVPRLLSFGPTAQASSSASTVSTEEGEAEEPVETLAFATYGFEDFKMRAFELNTKTSLGPMGTEEGMLGLGLDLGSAARQPAPESKRAGWSSRTRTRSIELAVGYFQSLPFPSSSSSSQISTTGAGLSAYTASSRSLPRPSRSTTNLMGRLSKTWATESTPPKAPLPSLPPVSRAGPLHLTFELPPSHPRTPMGSRQGNEASNRSRRSPAPSTPLSASRSPAIPLHFLSPSSSSASPSSTTTNNTHSSPTTSPDSLHDKDDLPPTPGLSHSPTSPSFCDPSPTVSDFESVVDLSKTSVRPTIVGNDQSIAGSPIHRSFVAPSFDASEFYAEGPSMMSDTSLAISDPNDSSSTPLLPYLPHSLSSSSTTSTLFHPVSPSSTMGIAPSPSTGTPPASPTPHSTTSMTRVQREGKSFYLSPPLPPLPPASPHITAASFPLPPKNAPGKSNGPSILRWDVKPTVKEKRQEKEKIKEKEIQTLGPKKRSLGGWLRPLYKSSNPSVASMPKVGERIVSGETRREVVDKDEGAVLEICLR